MATERKSPDAILASANLTPVNVAYIQDDPDSPDANWMTAIANNVASTVRVSFPNPTGNPTVGAGLQEFKAWVRKMGGSGTPTCVINLWENGVLVSEGTPINITNTSGQMVTRTWNANLLGTADGSLVEARVVGTAVGGAPSTRASIEIGAVEWNVTYSTAVVVTPPKLSLTLTAYIPTVPITDNKVITPSTLSLSLTLYAPTVTALDSKVVTPGVLALGLTPYIPTINISDNKVVTPAALALSLTAYSPVITVTNNITVTPSLLSLAITTYAPTITATDNIVITPGVLALTLTPYAPVITIGGSVEVTPGVLSLILTMFAPTVTSGYNWSVEELVDGIKVFVEAHTINNEITIDTRRDVTGQTESSQNTIITGMKSQFPSSTKYYKHYHYHGGGRNRPCVLEEV